VQRIDRRSLIAALIAYVLTNIMLVALAIGGA
jgi:hypothetical protein